MHFFGLFCNLILDAIAVFCRPQQPKLLKLEYKSTNRCIGRIAKVLFQLLGGELAFPILSEDKLPQGLFLFRDIAPAKAFWYISVVSGSGKTETSLWYTFSMK